MKHTSKYLKKALSAVMAFIMVFGAFSSAGIIGLVASAADDIRGDKPLYEAKNGEWKFYDDGELVFIGDKDNKYTVSSVDPADTKHWRDINTQEDFTGRVTSITIAPSVKTIKDNAFRFLNVSVVFVPDSVEAIETNAFEGSGVKTVYFPGLESLWKTKYGDKAPSNVEVKFDHRHSEGAIRHHAEATCLKEGYEGDWYCPVCGAFIKAGKTLSKTSHIWSKELTYIVDSNGKVEKETCKDYGRKARYCTICGEWDYANYVKVPANTSGHEFVMILDDKSDERVADCSVFFTTKEYKGKELADLIKKALPDVSFSGDLSSLKGMTKFENYCKDNYFEIDYTNNIIIEDLSKKNIAPLTCKHCGKKLEDLSGPGKDYEFFLDYVDKNDNKVGRYVLFGNDASGVNSGWKSIPADKQKLVVNKKAVEEYGMYREQMTYETPADALKHRRVTDTRTGKTIAPTCTEEGKTVITCEWCQAYNEEFKVAALGHSNKRGNKEVIVEITPPRCPVYDKETKKFTLSISDADGKRVTRCADCEVVLSNEKLFNLHDASVRSGTWVTVVEPTCVKDGVQQLRCNLCKRWIRDSDGKELTQPVPKTPSVHTESRWVYTKEPTCTDTGERIKFCLNKGCPYYVGNTTAATATEASDRAALELIQDVVKDTNRDNYDYSTATDAVSKEIYDVTDEINTVILARFKSGDLMTSPKLKELEAANPASATDPASVTDALAEEIENIIATAVKHHQTTRVNIETLEEEIILDEDYYNDKFTEADEGCVEESKGSVRYVFSEIVPLAAQKIVEKRSVINKVDDIIKALEDAWLELGDEAIKKALEANKGDSAELTNKATDKEEVAALGHNHVRVPYTTETVEGTQKYIPVVKNKDDNKWYKIDRFVEDEDGNWTPVPSENSVEEKHVIDKIDCTKGGGIILSTCTRCANQTKELVPERIEHDTDTETVEANCLEGKYKREYCKYCDYENITELGAALGHDFEEKDIREASCSKAGIKVQVCQRCGVIDESTYQTIPTLPHTDSPVHEDATCLEAGRDGMICSVCGRFEGKVTPALGHDYENIVTLPSCTEQGYTTPTCTRCGATKDPINRVPAAGHQYGETLTMPATCVKGSYTYEICKVCGNEKVYNEIDNALGHDWGYIDELAPTCTEKGHTAGKYCRRCDYVETKSTEIPATGHTPKNVPYKAASCTEDGNEAYVVCSKCGTELEKKVVLPKTGHHWKTTPGFDATCETAGQTESTVCEICGEYDKAPVTIPAKGHSWGAKKTIKEAILTGDDTLEHTCTVCGATEQWTYHPTIPERIVRLFKFIFSLPFKLMARANGD